MKVEIVGIRTFEIESDGGVVKLMVKREGRGLKQCWIIQLKLGGWIEAKHFANLLRQIAYECYTGKLYERAMGEEP